MSAQALRCEDRGSRRRAIRARNLNGLDFIELDQDHMALTVAFLEKAPDSLGPENVRIDGGRRIRDLKVTDVRVHREHDADRDDWMRISIDRAGDASTYTLRLVEPDERGRPGNAPMRGLDPRYSSLDFSFMAGCPTGLDCLPVDRCPPHAFQEPVISYLAKDYASFRQLILDRLALLMPDWKERHVPDLELAVIELLAYVGDYLSYYQDAVATEAYLETARRRISVRRHLRLIDYRLHEGCNARAWVVISVARDITLEPHDYRFITATPAVEDAPRALRPKEVARLARGSYEVFEPMDRRAIALRQAHNTIELWTWGEVLCCLDAGATSATLKDSADNDAPAERVLSLGPGDVIVFEEVVGPRTGSPADADPAHRQAVRLISVAQGWDEVFRQPVLEIEWSDEDRLRFPLCLSSVDSECRLVTGVSVARGNVILVDHGAGIAWCDRDPESVPVPPAPLDPPGCDPCAPEGGVERQLAVFTALLSDGPITHRVEFPRGRRVAAGQAKRVEGIEALARRGVEGLQSDAVGGEPLSDADIAGLRRLLGPDALEHAGLERDAASAAAALALLLGSWSRLIARKRHRLGVLARRARAGAVLGADEAEEIAETWGLSYAVGIYPPDATFVGPACDAMEQDPHEALAALTLTGPSGTRWEVRRDLLDSQAGDRHVVIEIDDEGRARLRFGDGEAGRAVDPDTTLKAGYRIGNGTAGNVGAGVISRIVLCETDQDAIIDVRNPLPACGGTDPKSVSRARLIGPLAIHSRRERAVTAGDYAAIGAEVAGVQSAAAHLAWTGSWYEAQVALDLLGGAEPTSAQRRDVAERLFRYRRIGHDLRVKRVEYAPIDLALRICVVPHVTRGVIQREALEALRTFFDPDALMFGTDVALSAIVAVVQALPGVESVEAVRFQRAGIGDRGELAAGVLRVGPFEIARLDNDPARPENGMLELELRGGR